MRTTLRSEDLQEIITVFELPDGYASLNGIQEFEASGIYKGIYGKSNVLLIDGFLINLFSMRCPSELITHVEKDTPHLEMHFELRGGHSFSNKSTGGMDIAYEDEHHALYYFPEMKGYVFNPVHEDRFCLEIQLSVEYLRKIFNNDLSILKEFGVSIEENRPAIFGNQCMPITTLMKQVIADIIHCKFSGQLKRVYLEAKVLELLSLQISQLNIQTSREPKIVLRKDDIEKLNYVRELVRLNLSEPYSLLELSKMTGLNNFKLKEGFKELFDNTIFGYLADERLQMAKSLLQHGEQSIAEISHIIGYKNPQHFTVAFKKKFGCLPKEFKKK